MIKFLVMDVDGTLTDGRIYMGASGELMKVFNIKDGCGIKDILPQYDIIPIVITARKSKILENRCQELCISNLYQGVRKKLIQLEQIIKDYNIEYDTKYGLADCAYIGDDVLDLECMNSIKKAGGVIGCPQDSIDEVKKIVDYISPLKGGDGAVRNFIEWLTNSV